MTRTPKQKFQFEREYSIKGRLTAAMRTLNNISRNSHTTPMECVHLKAAILSLHIILRDFTTHTGILKRRL